MKKIKIIFAILLTAIWAQSCTEKKQIEKNERPNILLVLADDMGWGDLGCYGHPIIQSPNLDKLASEGVRLTNCHSSSGVCSPSRSAILTGRTPYRNGVWRWIPENHDVYLRTSEITLATLLKKNGYETCHIGKWHLNSKFNSPEQPQPNDHGFDYWFATFNVARPSHKNPINFVRNGVPVGEIKGFSALICADEAIDWLTNKRNKNKPFYLQVWNHEPHLPIESDPKYMALYNEYDKGAQQYYGNITQIDTGFGKIMKALKDLGLDENTLVIFTSDNGPEGKTGVRDPTKRADTMHNRLRGSTGGFRGRKRSDYEGGIRVPGIIKWPGHIEPGVVSDIPVIGHDIFTTICNITNTPIPNDRVIDGADMRPAFKDEKIVRAKPLYWKTREAQKECRIAVRIDDWKIIANEDLNAFQLYNLKNDPYETNDLKDFNKEKFQELKKILLKMNEEVMTEAPEWVYRDQSTNYWKNSK